MKRYFTTFSMTLDSHSDPRACAERSRSERIFCQQIEDFNEKILHFFLLRLKCAPKKESFSMTVLFMPIGVRILIYFNFSKHHLTLFIHLSASLIIIKFMLSKSFYYKLMIYLYAQIID